MDRRILVGLLLCVIAASGCSKSKPPEAAGAAPPRRERAHATVAEAHRPVIVSEAPVIDSADSGQPMPMPAAPSPSPEPRFQFKTEQTFPDEVVEGHLEKPRSADLGLNPLRPQDEGISPSAPRVNPLRNLAPAGVPLAPHSIPSGGAAPPESLAPPDAVIAEAERSARELAEKVRAEAAAAAERASAASQASLRAAAPAENNLYDVVQVLYGTDRQLAQAPLASGSALALYFGPAGVCALATLCLALAALGRRSVSLGLVSLLFAAVSAGLGYQAATRTLAALRVADHEGAQYTTGRSAAGKVALGLCEVTIPKSHSIGALEAPSILRLEVHEDAAQHVVLRKTEPLVEEPFYNLLRERVAASPRKELFVFVHGFNVSFEDAARRTAQIHYDLRFEGAPILFSWPAHDKSLLTYPADENNVEWSAPHLKEFLLNVVQRSQAKSINLIAHSMGNRALAAALREIALELRDQSRLFNQVILAAPDIDAEEFRSNIAPAMQRTAQRLTLYASSRDDALLASQLLHRGPRAGDAGEGLVVVRGIDTIDVTAIDSSPWGHLYYGSSDPVLQDLKKLFTLAAAPPDRTWLSPAEREGLTYWIFQPARTATGEGAVTR